MSRADRYLGDGGAFTPKYRAPLCTALDHGAITVARDGIEAETPARIALIATDEGTEDESAHAALIDRLGIALDMTTLGIHDVDDEIFRRRDIERAMEMLDDVILSEEHLTALATLTASLGIDSPRPTLAAAKVARASAALRRSKTVEEEDVAPTVMVNFDRGEEIRVIDGPFASMMGKVEEVNPTRAKLRVLVSIFGRPTSVELDFTQVERLG